MTLEQFTACGHTLRAILIGSDEQAVELGLRLQTSGFNARFTIVRNELAFASALDLEIDIIFCQPGLPGCDTTQALEILRRSGLDVPVIVLSKDICNVAVSDLLFKGATDFFDTTEKDRLAVIVHRSLREAKRRVQQECAQHDLHESEQKFRELTRNMNEVFWLTSTDENRFIYISPAFEKIWGRSCKSLYDNPNCWLETIHPDDRAYVAKARATHAHSDRYDQVYRIVRPDGEVRWIRDRACPLFDLNGRVYRIAGIAEDMTDRHHLQLEIDRRERRLDSFFQSASIGMAILDPEFCYVQINETLATMNGISCQEHVGKPIAELLPALFARLHPVLQSVRDTHKPVLNVELSGPLCDEIGGRSWEASYFPIVGPNDELDGIGCVVIETTDRKALEAQLLQAQKLESVGRLAGGVAHDFNNLLCVMQGHAYLLESSMAPGSSDADSVHEILHAAERAAGVTRQLLLFSRKQVAQPQCVNLNDTIKITAKMLRRLVGEDVEVETDLAENLPVICADPGMMDQVLMNLAVNARDAMPRGGQLRIATSAREVTSQKARNNSQALPGAYVVLSVADTGGGIPPKVLEHIFEPFFTTKEPGKGTGLGLSMVYGIVKQHKGWIEVRSEVDKGATFEIYLPCVAQTDMASCESKVSTEKIRGAETVLLVEDDNHLRFLTRKSLEKFGYSVLEASNGPSALELWKKARFEIDVLITDVIMPESMSGVDLAKAIEQEAPGLPTISSAVTTTNCST